MPKKVTKRKRRSVSSGSNASEASGDKRGGVPSKFEEFNVSDVLSKPLDQPEPQEFLAVPPETESDADVFPPHPEDTIDDPNPNDNEENSMEMLMQGHSEAASHDDKAHSPGEGNDPNVHLVSDGNVAPIPQLIPPEPWTELPADEEFVPLATLQVVPSMHRGAEAQNGLLKEPNPPSNIKRVTQSGVPAPAMPTTLMELLSA